jgi:hypothetical protein
MTVSTTMGLGNWTLAEPSGHDFDMVEEILKDIDFECDLKLLLDSLVGSAFKRN